MNFTVTILGSGAALPVKGRMPTSQIVNVSEQLFMIDCAEGTQLQVRRFRQKLHRINHIFISHLHGDHYLGLPGLVSSMHLLGRKAPLNIYGPKGIKEIVEVNMKHSQTFLNFELIFNELDKDQTGLLVETSVVEVTAIKLNHRIPCHGFVFREKSHKPKMIKDMINKLSIGVEEIIQLKNGKDVQRPSGEVLRVSECTIPPSKPRSYAFCSDTKYDEKVAEQIVEVGSIYHESTFLEEHLDRAKKTYHSTASQAAKIANLVKARQLILGHFSSRYKSFEAFETEAGAVFPNSLLAEDGKTFKVEVPIV